MATRQEWSRRKGRSSSFVRASLRFAIYARDNFDCVYCRLVFPPALDGVGLTLDHVRPRKDGGEHTHRNMVTACPRCNASRQHKKVRCKRARDRARRAVAKDIDRKLGLQLAKNAKRQKAERGLQPRLECQ